MKAGREGEEEGGERWGDTWKNVSVTHFDMTQSFLQSYLIADINQPSLITFITSIYKGRDDGRGQGKGQVKNTPSNKNSFMSMKAAIYHFMLYKCNQMLNIFYYVLTQGKK